MLYIMLSKSAAKARDPDRCGNQSWEQRRSSQVSLLVSPSLLLSLAPSLRLSLYPSLSLSPSLHLSISPSLPPSLPLSKFQSLCS